MKIEKARKVNYLVKNVNTPDDQCLRFHVVFVTLVIYIIINNFSIY